MNKFEFNWNQNLRDLNFGEHIFNGFNRSMHTDMGSTAQTLTESDSEDGDVHVNMNQPLTTGDVPLFNSQGDYAWMAEWMMFLNVTRQPQEAYKHFHQRICMSAVYHAMVA